MAAMLDMNACSWMPALGRPTPFLDDGARMRSCFLCPALPWWGSRPCGAGDAGCRATRAPTQDYAFSTLTAIR
jgi:hypothetical protein